MSQWHYVRDGQQAGPVTSGQLKELVASGALLPTDLVWKEGMADWQPAQTIAGLFVPPVAALAGSAAECGAAAAPITTVLQAFGQVGLPAADATTDYAQASAGYAGPIGYATPQSQCAAYASFWARLAASLIDGLIIGVVSSIVVGLVVYLLCAVLVGPNCVGGAGVLVAVPLVLLAMLAANWLYHAHAESSERMATVGKRVMGLRVTDLYGNRITFGRATGRFFSKQFISGQMMIGYIIQPFTQRKQALHDLIASTLVLQVK